MSWKKRILSLLVALLLAVNGIPITAYAAESNTLTIRGKICDAVTNVEYGWEGKTYRFADGILKGVQEGDEAYLVADVEKKGALTVGAEVSVSLSNVRLMGADAAKYIAPVISEEMPIQKKIQIAKKTVKIAPEHSYIYFGQQKPRQGKIKEIEDYKEQLENGEDISIAASFQIQEGDYTAVGSYAVSLDKKPVIRGTDAGNYEVKLASDAEFCILAYKPEQTAVIKETPDAGQMGGTQIVLYAPEGFQISQENHPDDRWSDSIIIPSAKVQDGEYTYYLRNNDISDIEYYQAISEAKTYQYTSERTKEQEIDTGIGKADKNISTQEEGAADSSAPEIEISDQADTDYRDAAGYKLYEKDHSFTVTVTDTDSGIKEIGYRQSSEQNSYIRKIIELNHTGYHSGENLGDGWVVAMAVDDLVTQVTKTFDFTEDDNEITLIFDAEDHSGNAKKDIRSETFTVDKTPPDIKVEFQDEGNTYYKQKRIASIVVTERNFDANRIEIAMTNTLGDVPLYKFEEKSKTEHIATIDFDEGNYTFGLTGTDLGNHLAQIIYEGGNEGAFGIDKSKPEVKIKRIDGNYIDEGGQRAVKADMEISDSISGVAKVEYLWDDGFLLKEGDSEYQTDYKEFSDYAEGRTDYQMLLPWNLAKSVPGNRHTLHLRVTDKAGNVYDDVEPVTDPDGSDMIPPQIESIEIRKPESDGSEDSLRFFTSGTFYRKAVEIAIKANDQESEEEFFVSGVKSVRIDGKEAVKNEEKNEYVLTVRPDEMMSHMCVTVEDHVGNKTEASVMEIPDRGMIQSDDLIIEDDGPVINFGGILSQGHEDNEGHVWFGSNDNDIEMKITAADDQGSLQSGLLSVIIKDNGKVKYSNTDFSLRTTEHTETFKIDELSDGEHIFTVEAEDNCGNTIGDSITFYKDTDPPEKGVLTAISPQSVNIGGRQWYDKDEVITFRVDAADAASGLKNIFLEINGKSFDYVYSQIKSDDAGYYISVDTTGIAPDREHKYTVTGTVTDFAENELKLKKMIVYKDFESPIIEKITVQKKTSTLDKVLRVLTFGVYSNDTLIFKAYTQDADFDSGIDYATVQYSGLSASERMKDEGDGVFSAEITAEDTVFESDLLVEVYDKYGKRSLSCPNLADARGDAVSNGRRVMIETVLPVAVFSLPESDSISRTDGQVWYRSNKKIKLAVQDQHSGINNIDLSVNGIEVLEDKKGSILLKTEETEAADKSNTDKLQYTFDTDYFSAICGEAKDGKYVIAVKVADHAGNAVNMGFTYYMDKESPVIDRIDFIPETSDGVKNTSEFIEELAYGYFFRTDFKVSVNVSDTRPSSGLHEVRYRLVSYQNGKRLEETGGSKKIRGGKVTLNVPKGFKGQIFVEAFDYVLNRSGEKTAKAYVVDSDAPDIQITKNTDTTYHDAAGNNLYVETNSFTVVVTDIVSGIRQIGYSQSAERNPYDRKTIDVNLAGYDLDADLGDGWKVTGVDANLVTQAEKTFVFSEDDNDVIVTFDAADHSLNRTENVQSERFTIDMTAPVINVVFREDDDTDIYYNQNRVADVTVIERNFSAELIKVEIENTFGEVPGYLFTENSNTEHTAVIDFDEGDYTFHVAGRDLGDHPAMVHFSGGNENMFCVDKTKPVIEENFSEFSNSAENSFKIDKTADIKITEHNFDPELVNLKITRKEAGEEHNAEGMEDVTGIVLGDARWKSKDDVHTISFTFDQDAVYYIEMTPVDLATNIADWHSTVFFEIDKTAPVVSMKNGSFVDEDDTEFLDIYPYARKDEEVPSVEFEDLNLSHLKYKLTVYTPNYSTSDVVAVRPSVTSGTIEKKKYKLPDFKEDGVYALELTAVDVAGNESTVNYNTYARMVDQDVLAYIMESSLEEKTGLYSFEYENGETISKKPSDFKDLKIFVMTKKETPTDIVLRDSNGKEISTNAQCTTDDSIYGMGIYNYLLKSDFFKENFQDDTDMEMHLTVKNQGYRIDLGKMHIDNMAPTCTMPERLDSWQWFYGETDRIFTLSNISELIDEDHCVVYDNGKKLPFIYYSDDNTMTFTLEKGWHNVGIILDDMAGNANNIQEKTNIHIGYFWFWMIAVILMIVITVIGGIVIYIWSKKKKERDEVW